MNQIWSRIVALVELGGPVIALLIGLSVLALAVGLYKTATFLVAGIGRPGMPRYRSRLIDRVAGKDNAEVRSEAALGELESGFRLLDAIAQIAPLLGLFGTVLGMIEAFQTLQSAGNDVDPAALAGGIWVALTTTAAGLAVAMPTSLILTWLDARLSRERLLAAEALAVASHERHG